MDPIVRFYAKHPVLYVLSIVGAATFGLVALVRVFREETRLARARDIGLAAVAAGEVGGLIAMRDKLCDAESELDEAEGTLVAV